MELDKRHIIYPQAILQPERAAHLRPETILVMAQVIVTLHNDMLSAPMKGGFALLDGKVSPALVDNSALFDFGEMATIGPWINKQGALVLDFVFDIGLKNARCVRHGRKVQILAREGALASRAPPDASGQPTNKAEVDWVLMSVEDGTRDMTWEQIEEGAEKLRVKGGKTAQIVARAGPLVSGALPDAYGQPTNKAAADWLLMGAEEGTRDMTWEQIEEGADKLRAEGGCKGGKTAQIVARAGALVSGAPCDDSGQPTNKAAVDWMFMGAEKGTRGVTWQEIEEGADELRVEGGDICKTAASRKRKGEGGLRGNDAMKVASLARGQDDRHSHACILPWCGMFCTPTHIVRAGKKDTLCIRHGCRVAQKKIYGFSENLCRNCHQTATQCKAAVCTYIAFSSFFFLLFSLSFLVSPFSSSLKTRNLSPKMYKKRQKNSRGCAPHHFLTSLRPSHPPRCVPLSMSACIVCLQCCLLTLTVYLASVCISKIEYETCGR